MHALAGTWTYRSFFNLPTVDKFEELRFAEAELSLHESETADFLTGRLSFGAAYLDMVVFVPEEHGRQAVRMRATGVKGTTTEGWIYDYVGHLAQAWPHGDGQRPAIVGTVVRTAPHAPERFAGVSASFIAVHRSIPTAPYKLPANVIEHFAGRLHRLHHAAWHGIRNGWDLMSEEKRKLISALDWATPRPARAYGKDGVFLRPHITNGSGEDFLFFHRQMVVAYKTLMAHAGQEPIEWTLIPEPGDQEHAVPPTWPFPGDNPFARRIAALKSDAHYWSRMRWWDQGFKDQTYLATLTLGELGALLEYSVHNDMHMRWSAAPRDPVTKAIVTFGRPQHDFSVKWDNPVYDWLGEFYASHVNPFFWRLHGWIDDRIDDWFAAHEARHPGEIARVTKGGVDWFERGRWVLVDKPWVWPESLGGFEGGHGGGHGGHAHGGHDDGERDSSDPERLASLEALVAILYPPPKPQGLLAAGADDDTSPELARALSPIFGANDSATPLPSI